MEPKWLPRQTVHGTARSGQAELGDCGPRARDRGVGGHTAEALAGNRALAQGHGMGTARAGRQRGRQIVGWRGDAGAFKPAHSQQNALYCNCTESAPFCDSWG